MSSWKRKMRVKWNRNLDGSANNSEGVFERQGSLRKPKDIHREEPFKRSWSFRLGNGKDSKDSSPVGQVEKDVEKHNVLLRLFRFKDKKRGSVTEGKASGNNRRSSVPSGLPVPRRRMSDVTAFVEEKDKRLLNPDLSQWASVPVDVNGAVPPVQEPQPELSQWGSVPAGMVTGDEEAGSMRSHTLPRGLPGVRSSPMLVDAEGRARVDTRDDESTLGTISCAPGEVTLSENCKKNKTSEKVVEIFEGKTEDESRAGSDEAPKLPRPDFFGLGKVKEDRNAEGSRKKLVVNGEDSHEKLLNGREVDQCVLRNVKKEQRTADKVLEVLDNRKVLEAGDVKIGAHDNGNADENSSGYEKVFAKAVVPHFIQCDNGYKRNRDGNANFKVLRLNGNLLEDTCEFEDTLREKVLVNGIGKPRETAPSATATTTTTTLNGNHEDVSTTYDMCEETEPTGGLEGGSPNDQNKTPRIPAASPTVQDKEAQINAVGETSCAGGRATLGQEFDELDGYEEDSVFESIQLDDESVGGDEDFSDDVSALDLNRTYVLEPDESVELLNDVEESLIEELRGARETFGDDESVHNGDGSRSVECEDTDRPNFVPFCEDESERFVGSAETKRDHRSCNVTNIFIDSAGPISYAGIFPKDDASQDDDFVTYVQVDPPAQTLAAQTMEVFGEVFTESEQAEPFEAKEENPTERIAMSMCNDEDTLGSLKPLQQLCDSEAVEESNGADQQSSSTGSESSSRSGSVPTEIEVRCDQESSSPDMSDSALESPTASRKNEPVESQPADPLVEKNTDGTDSQLEEKSSHAPGALQDAVGASASEAKDSGHPTGLIEDDFSAPCEEASFREKLYFFDTISSPLKTQPDISRLAKTSRIPTPSRLPRPSTKTRQDTPAPPKRARAERPVPKTTSKFESGDLVPTKQSTKVSKTDATPLIVARPDLRANERVASLRGTKGSVPNGAPEISTQQRHETPKVSRTDPKRASITTKKLPSKLASKVAESKKENKLPKTKVPLSNKENLVAVDKESEDAPQMTVEQHNVDVPTPGCLVRSRTFTRDDDEETDVATGEADTVDSGAMKQETATNCCDSSVAHEEPTVVIEGSHDGQTTEADETSAKQKLLDTTNNTAVIVKNDEANEEQRGERLKSSVPERQEVRPETGTSSDAAHMPSSPNDAKHVRDLVAAIMDSVQVPVVDSTSNFDEDYAGDDTFQFKKPSSTLKLPQGVSTRGKAGGDTRVGHPLTKAEFTKEIQRLGALCEARTKEANFLKLQLKHASAGFAAFGVLLRHLTEQHDVFSVPHLTEELQKSRQEIDRARAAIEQYKADIEELKQKQLGEIEAMKEKILQKHATQLEELEAAHKNEIATYIESHTKKTEELKSLYSSIIEEDRKSRDEAIDALKEKHKEKIEAINEEYTIQLDAINDEHAAEQAQLEAKHTALMDQYRALQEQAREFQSSVLLDTDAKIQWLSKKNADLQKEVESLNVVLEMRAEQIQALQRSKLEMERKEEELERCKDRIQKLEARNEDLQELLNEKVKLQSQLSVENAVLRENSEKQNRQLSRLDMHNEELKYKLRESSNQSFTYV
ncbi:uncharacterized protein LOC135394759 isoform X2 [Ornithodoros turicata]|uniref:uncharacterized protein LOC135394759 isoform X2 n=1 Tax=Ornithodoros turicata TaxID=34597 RepID=UPI00313872E4